MAKELSDKEFVDRLVDAGWKRWEAEKELEDIKSDTESGISHPPANNYGEQQTETE